MSPSTFSLCLLLAITWLQAQPNIEACSCIPKRDRNVGCKNEFMAVVRITGERRLDYHDILYSFSVLEDFTTQLATPNSLTKFENIETAAQPGVCGVHLSVGSVYVLKGSLSLTSARLVLCNAYASRLDLTPSAEQSKAMLAQLYRDKC